MRLRHQLAKGAVAAGALFALIGGLLPVGARRAKPAVGHYQLHDVELAGPGAVARPSAGGQPGSRGALALAAPPRLAAPAGWSARVQTPDHPLMVALSWQGKSSGEVQLRAGDGAKFGPWTDVDGTPGHGPDSNDPNKPRDRTSTDPVWVGPGTSEIEIKVTKGEMPGLRLTRFTWQGSLPSAGSAGLGTGTAGAEPANPGVHLRSDWDGGQGWRYDIDGCQGGPEATPALQMAVVHHTVNANDYSSSQVPLLINGIYQWHTNGNGWCDIGYDFLVDRFGGIWQGRSGDIALPIWGAHAVGFNYQTVGVSLLGSFQPNAPGAPPAANPSPAMINSLTSLIAWKFGLHGIDPLGTTRYIAGAGSHWPDGTPVTINTIVGHRDTSSTDCPGDNVEVLMPQIRQQVAQKIAAAALPPSHWAPFTSAHGLVSQQFSDILYRAASNTDDAYWTNWMVSLGRDGPGIADLLMATSENQTTTVPVLRLYFAVFGRWADYGGLSFWSRYLKGGHSLVDVASQMAGSREFQSKYGNTTNQRFVDLLYQNVLGRPADASGEAFWVGKLNSGLPRGAVVFAFSESRENIARQAANTDVGQVYEPMLHRAPDPSGFLWALNIYRTQSRYALVRAVWGSPEYRSRF